MVSPFVHISDIVSLFVAELDESKIGISGRGVTDPSKNPMQVISNHCFFFELFNFNANSHHISGIWAIDLAQDF